MPLETQEDYERLGEHLFAIDVPLREFASAHGYIAYHPLSGGRYPNRRISVEGPVSRTIHIAMCDDPAGNRHGIFFPEIPYTVFAAACIYDHQEHKLWHSLDYFHTRPIPFSSLLAHLPLVLRRAHEFVSAITPEEIYSYDYATPLAPLPSGLA